ncbi:ribosome maturation factor RimP [Gammaproteobacteria bacterium]
MPQTQLLLQQMIEPVVTAMGYEFVGLEFLGQARRYLVRVYIDNPAGVRLEDCSRVSHQISGLLEVEDPISGPYTLEVSSPGLERPLFGERDFLRFSGKKVHVKLSPRLLQVSSPPPEIAGRRKITGLLKGVQESCIIVEEEKQDLSVPLEYIENAHLVL